MSALDDFVGTLNNVQNSLNGQNNPLTQDQVNQFKESGFLIPATFSADGNGLPSSKVPSVRQGQIRRNIMTFFIPDFGVVRLFVNPENLVITDKKLIHKDRTKGGFTMQYWGEELTEISLTGTTGSSGIEGINVLHEIYRAEQYAFDATGLTLAANNAAADVSNNLVNGIGGMLGQSINGLFGGDPNSPSAAAAGSGLLGGILGLDSPNNTLSAKNIPTLAQSAFTVEMYYMGWVYRGWFDDMTITERANDFTIQYSMKFTATSRRGYRLNYFPFSRSAIDGPSNFTTPHSYNGNIAQSVLQQF